MLAVVIPEVAKQLSGTQGQPGERTRFASSGSRLSALRAPAGMTSDRSWTRRKSLRRVGTNRGGIAGNAS